jgi:pyruvate formate lyase activating enzyme
LRYAIAKKNEMGYNYSKEETKGANMLIKGLQKLTLLDYPGKIACTLFLGGCNFRCPFCHNASLVLPELMGEDIAKEDFLAFLESRRGRLQGVCVSGGEPTLHSDLPELLAEIKERGFSVKLDTNGTNPEMLLSLINDGLVDYVAMDIKNSKARYAETVGVNFNLDTIEQSVAILMQGRVNFEFRTTLMRELHTVDDVRSIGEWITGDEKMFLQPYRDEGDLIVGGFTPPTPEEISTLLSVITTYVPSAEIRG